MPLVSWLPLEHAMDECGYQGLGSLLRVSEISAISLSSIDISSNSPILWFGPLVLRPWAGKLANAYQMQA